ncbi:MAG TPA: hypothetical protein VG074_15015 [Acidimicrobiales bacterium]|jgi:hypothetical protein|nr:hypothetical protein [Acidimicrobiales bacterium]
MPGIGSNIFGEAGVSVGGTGTSSNASPALAAQTYGPADTGGVGAFSPRHGHGAGFWLAVGGVVVLVLVRQSLPR